MAEDRSLDEFVGGRSEGSDEDVAGGGDGGVGDDDATGDDDGTATDPDDPTDDASDPAGDASDPASDGVDPATTTSAWAGTGDECERCGGTATRRWNDDGELVCAECKEW